MGVDLFYKYKSGRLLFKILQKSGALKIAAAYLHSDASRWMIRSYIRRNHIDMSDFAGQKYRTYADFFRRKKMIGKCRAEEHALISPCDSLLSIYSIYPDLELAMKGSHYSISDLIPKKKVAEQFAGGLCLVFRLQASDYHHFCYFDDGLAHRTHFIPGELHSVQPIAIRTVPVYRLNRRWWTLLDTKHFGRAAQIEVGAVLVGGVTHKKKNGVFRKGEEMGNFELCGSTIIVLLTESARKSLRFEPAFARSVDKGTEVRVKYGETIGYKDV